MLSRNWFEIIAVFIIVCSLLLNTYIGGLAALLFLVAGINVCLLDINKLINTCWKNKILLAIPLLACISYFWSELPNTSLRSGIQLLLTCIISIGIATNVKFENFLKASSTALFLILLISLLSGRYHLNGMTGEYSLVGMFGSKNQMSMNSVLGVIIGISLFSTRFKARLWKFFGITLVLLSITLLLKGKSVGAVAATFFTIFTTLLLRFYNQIDFIHIKRKVLNHLILFFSTAFIYLLFYSIKTNKHIEFMYQIGKDPTLTGRTFLWERAEELIATVYYFGNGFQSVFVVGQGLAEEIWEFFRIPSGAGFNFHNVFLDLWVELGLFGVLLFMIMLFKTLQCLLSKESLTFNQNLLFASLTFIFMLSQCFLEANWFRQFTLPYLYVCIAHIYIHSNNSTTLIKVKW